MAECLIILLEQGIDEGDQPSNHMTNGLCSSFVGLRPLVISAKSGNQALVQASPFCPVLNRVPRPEGRVLINNAEELCDRGPFAP